MDLLHHTKKIEPSFLQLSQVFHTTLEVNDLIKYFHQVLQPFVPYHHLHYYHPAVVPSIELGTSSPAQYKITSALHLNHAVLGEITLSKPSPFTSSEINMIEEVRSFLLYPLLHALRYQEAITHALIDPLTQLGNRRAFNTTFSQEMDFALRHQLPLSLLMIDIDQFKEINDQKGHAGGDAVLSQVGTLINQIKRKTDLAFRYGGEEFAILLKNTPPAGAMCVAERLRKKIQNGSFSYQGKIVSMTVSIGIATSHPLETTDKLFTRSDKALYIAKKKGRSQIVCN